MSVAWLRCPEPHAAEDPESLKRLTGHGYDPSGATAVTAALIAEGQCPACPTRRLEPGRITVCGKRVSVGRCPCCRAAWRADADGWEALDTGRLLAAPSEMHGRIRLYGLTEIARAACITPNLAKQWHLRRKLPPADAVLAMGPVWRAETIEPWLRERSLSLTPPPSRP